MRPDADLSPRAIPRQVTDAWLAPLLGQRAVRRDLAKYLRAAARDRQVMVAAAEGLGGLDQPAQLARAIRQFVQAAPDPDG
jgi:hypothetical protein